ncbi:MAG: hypothetical protein DRG82_16190 [Deltaproteobacteria bacterium]|nr:MAG: hypothetical protein DRG82_16190 [Deltaproteobacteria bacterium]
MTTKSDRMGEKNMDLTTLKNTPPWEWPEGADEIFLEILRDDQADASDRLLAAELAPGCRACRVFQR